MLAKPTTKDFIQIRTAPIKLRRELQGIQFLTPLEIEHAVMRTGGHQGKIIGLLQEEGYTKEEIQIAITSATKNGYVIDEGGIYALKADRIEIVRRYCILDVIANYGGPVSVEKQAGVLFVPGFEICWGLPQNQAIKLSLEVFPVLKELWTNPQDAFDDVQWLITNGFIIAK